MWKKLLSIGLVLLIIGAAGLAWAFAQQKKEKQLQHAQQEELNARIAELNKLVVGEIDVHSFADSAAADNRQQQELDNYQAQGQRADAIFTASIVCMVTGGTIFAWWLLLWTARLLIRGFSYLAKFCTGIFSRRKKTADKEPAEAHAMEDKKNSEQKEINTQQNGDTILRRFAKWGPNQSEKRSKVLMNSGWQNFSENYANPHQRTAPQTPVLAAGEHQPNQQEPIHSKKPMGRTLTCETSQMRSRTDLRQDSDKPGVLLRDERLVESEEALNAATDEPKLNVTALGTLAQGSNGAALLDSHKHPEFLNNAIQELTQEVSAIREYASHQQGKMEKLQDGYDWNIIKNFCLRVIRCIDNLEKRIVRLSKQGTDACTPSGKKSRNSSAMTHLEEVRDELVFALESSGVEQFEPEINSDYRGQEKIAETIKDKQHCDDPKLKGKVARVLRRGYQYVIGEGNVKIVRTARVKLFG